MTTRAPLRTLVELPLIAAATTWAAMLSWSGFTAEPITYLAPVAVVGAVIALSGAVLRWRRVPGVLVVLAQVVIGLVVTSLVVNGHLLPGPALVDALRTSFDSAQTYASPVPETDTVTVHPLLVCGGAALMLMVDVLACTVGRVPLAGLPVLAVYTVPVSLLDDGLSWWIFALTAFGFLVMLFVQEQQQVGRWGRSLTLRGAGPQPGWRPHNDAVRVSATLIGGIAVVLAVLVPLAVPTLSLSVFDFGHGKGKGSAISVNNPIVDLRRDLRQGDDIPLLTVTTPGDPSYLRISVLNRFTGEQWSSGDREVPSSNQPNGVMPALDGVSPSLTQKTYDYRVQVSDDFRSTWLPTKAPISAITATGDWRYDTSTMDFIAGDDDLTTAGMDYDMTAVDLGLTRDQLIADSERADTGVADELTYVPLDLPSIVSRTARDVTAEATSPFEKAVALQNWFRTKFTYSLDRATDGSSGSDLAAFIDPSGRVGYCEQFAASMAIMARELGIPARVAVGFLQPDASPTEPDTYVFSAHDLHAWPELYFQGAGWVRFEPTPGGADGRTGPPPSYTKGKVSVVDPSESTSTSQGIRGRDPEQLTATGAPTPRRDVPTTTDTTAQPSGGGTSIPWLTILVVLVALALLALLVVLPRTLRTRRRGRRLAASTEAVWDELRDTALDLRLGWPEGRSPRATRDRVVATFGRADDLNPAYRPVRGADQAPAAVDALDRIVLELELARYSRSHAGGQPGASADDALLVIDAMTAGATPRARRTATWLPRSLFRRTRRDAAGRDGGPGSGAAAPEQPAELVGSGTVEHL